MAVSEKIVTARGSTTWIRASGSADEVLGSVSTKNITASKVVYYSEGATSASAVAVYCIAA